MVDPGQLLAWPAYLIAAATLLVACLTLYWQRRGAQPDRKERSDGIEAWRQMVQQAARDQHEILGAIRDLEGVMQAMASHDARIDSEARVSRQQIAEALRVLREDVLYEVRRER